MKTTKKILILTVILALFALPAYAQRRMQSPPPDERQREAGEFAPERGADPPPSEERREEIRKKIEAIRIWRLTEELQLDANTSAKLASVLAPLDQRRRDILREQTTSLRDLRIELRSSKPDASRLKAGLDTLDRNHHAMQELRDREFEALKGILSVEQQARYLIFQQDFQREMRGMIDGAREGRGPMGPGGERRRNRMSERPGGD